MRRILIAYIFFLLSCSVDSGGNLDANSVANNPIIVGGENAGFITSNTPITLTWEAGEGTVFLEISTDGGQSFNQRIEVENSGTYTWHPPQESSSGYVLRITAEDGTLLVLTDDFVVDSASPELLGEAVDGLSGEELGGALVFSEDSSTEFDLSSLVSDFTQLSYDIVSQPENGTVTCSAQGVCQFEPNPDFSGNQQVTIAINDSAGQTTELDIEFTVESVDDPPTSLDSARVLVEETPLLIEIKYSDPEGDPATQCDVFTNSNVSISQPCSCSSGTCTVELTPSSNFAGETLISHTVTTNGLRSAAELSTLTVTNVDDVPLVNLSIANQNVDQDAFFNLGISSNAITSVDAEDVLSFDVLQANDSALPTWLSFNPATLALSGTPTNADVGTLNLKLVATDQSVASLSSQIDFDLVVNNINDAPVLSHSCAADIVDGESYNCTVSSSDIDVTDSTTITMEAGSCPWLQFDGTSTVSSLASRPNTGDVGNCQLRLRSTDDGSPVLFHDVVIDIEVHAKPTVGFQVGNSAVNETDSGPSVEITLNQSMPAPVSVNYNVSGTAEITDSGAITKDHNLGSSGSILIPANTTSYNWPLSILNDDIYELNETLVIDLASGASTVVGGITQHTVTLSSEDALPQLSIGDASSVESTNIDFPVSIDRISEEVVNFEVTTSNHAAASHAALFAADGPSNQDQDYVPITSQAGTVSAGQNSANITITVNSDTTDEFDETFQANLALGASPNATLSVSTAIGTIQNDDSPPSIQFSAAQFQPNETSLSGSAGLILSEKSGKVVSVDVTASDNTAIGGTVNDASDPSQNVPTTTDYQADNQTVNIPIGQTAENYLFTVVDDGIIDNGETFDLTISNPVRATLGAQTTTSVQITDLLRNCLEIYTADNSSVDGMYTIDPDGTGPMASRNVYCEMSDGGWTWIVGNSNYSGGAFPVTPSISGVSTSYANGEIITYQGSNPSGACRSPIPALTFNIDIPHTSVYLHGYSRGYNATSVQAWIDLGSDGSKEYHWSHVCHNCTSQTTHNVTRTAASEQSSSQVRVDGNACQATGNYARIWVLKVK